MTTAAGERAEDMLRQADELEAMADESRDERTREQLSVFVRTMIERIPPVPASSAARLLHLNERTVRDWAAKGVFPILREKPLALDPARVHEVSHLVRDLRAAGKTHGLLDEVWYQLSDLALLDREDLQESLEQMRRGEGIVVRPRPPEKQ